MSGNKGGSKAQCAKCSKAPTCVLPATWSGPVRRCDQFVARSEDEGHPEAPGREAPEDLRAPKGLCVTCEKMPDCPFPWPEEGVWHCENYR
jgi:hypothetical protein